MNCKIFPSILSGTISIPASKSATHRSFILASLASGITRIKNILVSDDTLHTLAACQAFGVNILRDGDCVVVEGNNGTLTAPQRPIAVGNSGTSLRMLSGMAAIAKGKTTITGNARLQERPMKDLLDALVASGIHAVSTAKNNCPPIEITGGVIAQSNIAISGNVSSQYITSLLLIAPFAKKDVTITVTDNLRSKPYVALTIAMMKEFGVDVVNKDFKTFTIKSGQSYVSPKIYVVDGDYSSASYFFAAAAISGNKITVTGLKETSSQGDKYFLDILEKMGCTVVAQNSSIAVKRVGPLKALDIDMADYPDLVPTLAVVAANANGTTKITNIAHLAHKETNRITAVAAELKKMGVRVTSNSDSLTITGGKPMGASIETYDDHRIAMSFAIAALSATGESEITNASTVSKSYPDFFEDLEKLGARMEKI